MTGADDVVDWFKGLSGKFLGSRAGKLLLLAGTDRLDKPLMIGQMQGIPPSLVDWGNVNGCR